MIANLIPGPDSRRPGQFGTISCEFSQIQLPELSGDCFDLFRDVLGQAVEGVVGAELAGNLQTVVLDIDCNDPTAPVAAGGDDAQADEPAAVNGDNVAHPGVGHVHAVQAHGRHYEQAGGFLIDALWEQSNPVGRVGLQDGRGTVDSRSGGDFLTVSQLDVPVSEVVDSVTHPEAQNVFADVLDNANTLVAGAEGCRTVVQFAGDGRKLGADADAGVQGPGQDVVGARVGQDDLVADKARPAVGDQRSGFHRFLLSSDVRWRFSTVND